MTYPLDRLPQAGGLTPPQLFADGADLPTISKLAEDPMIDGFTTNPTLLAKAGVSATRPSPAALGGGGSSTPFGC
jgi:transaldolase